MMTGHSGFRSEWDVVLIVLMRMKASTKMMGIRKKLLMRRTKVYW